MKYRVAVDSNVNTKKLKPYQGKGLLVLLRAQHENETKYIKPQGHTFRAGISTIGGLDKIVTSKETDIYIDIIKTVGKNNQKDGDHIYSAYLNNCDYFVTEDSDILMHKNKLMELLNISISNLEDFMLKAGIQ